MSLNLSSNFLQFNFEMENVFRHGVYEFDEFRLDPAKLMLYRDGQEITLPPKAVKTLLALIENQGEIISKEDLMNRVWNDAAVEESNLSQNLYLLRKTLGSMPDSKPYIETLRRRGYRFNGIARISTQNQSSNESETVNLENKENENFSHSGFRDEKISPTADESYPNSTAKNQKTRLISVGKTTLFAAVSFGAILFLLSFVWFGYERTAPSNANTELTIERLTNGVVPFDATISPDGNYFVYHESDGNLSRIVIQQTGTSNRLEIVPPTAMKFLGKTFSPDGAFVYFVAEDKAGEPYSLYRVSTLGGVKTQVMTDVFSPPSFSPDGSRMVFERRHPQTNESALIIATSDGKDQKVFRQNGEDQEKLTNPVWSPDGERIAYCASDRQKLGALFAADLQTGETASLSPEKWDNCYRMFWTRDGSGLVFIGTRYAEAFSTRRDQIYYLTLANGRTRGLTTDGSRHFPLSLGITNDDSVFAVAYNRVSQIWKMSADGDSRTATQITDGLADGRSGLVPLADGRVGYITRTGDKTNIWLMNGNGEEQKQLTTEPPNVEELRASEDGKFFVFASSRDRQSRLYRVDTDGSNFRQMTFDDSHTSDSAISPDGKWIVYDSDVFSRPRGKRSLWKIPSAGGEPVLVSDTDCATPHFSPDGKTLSCVIYENQIIILSAETGEILKKFEPVQIPVLNIGARFTTDGRNLVYMVLQKNVSNLWSQPIDGAPPRSLTNFTSGSIYNFAFSPDGTQLYVARGNQVNDAILIKNYK